MSKHVIAPKVLAELYGKTVEGQVSHYLSLLVVNPGPKPVRGSTRSRETYKALVEFVEGVYKHAVQSGYDMACDVFDVDAKEGKSNG